PRRPSQHQRVRRASRRLHAQPGTRRRADLPRRARRHPVRPARMPEPHAARRQPVNENAMHIQIAGERPWAVLEFHHADDRVEPELTAIYGPVPTREDAEALKAALEGTG